MKKIIRLVAVVAAVVVQSLSSWASDVHGITNIHVNAFVPFQDPAITRVHAGNASMWLNMVEGGAAQKIYLDQHYNCLEKGLGVAITNATPDAVFPTNTVMAHVWRGRATALTNAYNVLSANVAKTIIDAEAVNLLTNFAPIVKSVTRGVGSATIAYVDDVGETHLGKTVVLGCEPGDTTAYDVITNELQRFCQGYETNPIMGSTTKMFVVTNATMAVLGSTKPVVVCGRLGRISLCTSIEIANQIIQTAVEHSKTGKKPYYDRMRYYAATRDAELKKIDPIYASYKRDFKTEGFERFAYAEMSGYYQPAVAKMLEQLGLDPALAATNKTFRYLATLCSEKCEPDNTRMRIDIQGTRETLRLLGATMRVSNLFLVNAGILDEDFMTFDEDWKFDPETLAEVKGLATAIREGMGLNGVDYWFEETNDWTTAFADVGYVPGKKFEQLFCAGTAGTAEENPCALCLPTNTVAGFVFQPEVSAWVELNQHFLSLLGAKDENLNKIMDAFKRHPDSFGKSAALGLVLGSSNQALGSLKVSNGMDLISVIKVENENLWTSIRILLEQLGCEMHVALTWPEVTYCVLPRSGFYVAYDRAFKTLHLATSKEASKAVHRSLRDEMARLVSAQNKVFNERMGFNGEPAPDHNVLYYFAPGTDTALLESLGDYLDTVGLGALNTLIKAQDRSDLWFCGYGAKDGNGVFSAKSNISKDFWDKYHPFFKASCKTFGQIAAAAFPYDASKARVFVTGGITLHVSRADNWDDVNGRLYPYDGDNIRLRVQTHDFDGELFDRTLSARLDADGHFAIEKGRLYFRGYLTSEGSFCEFNGLAPGYFIGRLAPEIEPELSVLPSAKEVAEEVKKVVEAIGIESATVGAAKSDDRTGPFGEDTVVRETTIVPTPGGGLDRLIAKKPYANKTPMTYYMPSNTAFGTMLRFADGALTNAIAAIKYAQPELMEYLEKLFGGLGFDSEILASVKDGLALGIAKEADDLEPYFVVRLNRGQKQHWVDLTNRLYTAKGVTVTDFKASQFPDTWESIAFTFENPLTGRTVERAYTRVFESADRDPVFIMTRSTELKAGIMARVRRAGVNGLDRLVDDPTYKACAIPTAATDSTVRGFIYLAPIADAYWFYERLHATEDGEFVIERRTSAAVAPYEATVARFAVNFFEALQGEKSKITFENDPEADKIAEAATSNVVASLRRMRTALGVTGFDFYDADPDADGRYGNSELAIGTRGDGCSFMKRFAANAPASEHLVEQFIPATASALATVNGEPSMLADDVDNSLKAAAELLAENYPEASVAITNFLASNAWRISKENIALTGTHKAFAVLQDLEHPFTKQIGADTYASVSAGYAVLGVIGPMTSGQPFFILKETLDGKEGWQSFTTNGVEYLTYSGIDEKVRPYVQPTFAYNAANNVMVFATLPRAAVSAIRAGRDGENRLIDSETFADVMGFDPEAEMPEHNTLYYLAPQNDDILGCTLRRILGPYLPDGYAMLLDRPSLKGYWGGAYGKRVKDAFRLYIHAGMKGHTAFLAAGQALLKTAAESMRVRQPYDWTESKVFRSADWVELIEPTGETNVYSASYFFNENKYDVTTIHDSGSDNVYEFYDTKLATILSRNCIFTSTKGVWTSAADGRSAFRLFFLDETVDPADYMGGVAMELDAIEQTFPAGEKVEQALRIYPVDAKVTKVTGLPKGLSLKKMSDGYYLVGTPNKVGEDCAVWLTATYAGRQTSERWFHFTISNYESDYAELDAGYDLTAGVEDALSLTNVIDWTASGVPSGMKFDKETGELSGTPAKPGEYVVVFSKKIDGVTEKVSTVITVGQEDGIQIKTVFSDKTSGLRADGVTRAVYVGVKVDWPVEVNGLEDVETKLTAKGLPNGLKLVKTTDKLTGEVSYSIQGIATKASSVDRKTGEVKPSTVVLSGTNKYKWKGEEMFDLVVKALPDWAVGTFTGHHGSTVGDLFASTKVTVSKVGKVSVSINGVAPATGRTTVDTFTLTGFDSYDSSNKCFAFSLENVKMKSGNVYRFAGAIDLDPNLEDFPYDAGRFTAYVENEDRLHIFLGGNFDWTMFSFPAGKSAQTLELTDENNPGLEGLTLKFANGGKVTVAGTVYDKEAGKDVRVSASAALVYKSDTDVVYDGVIPASVGFVVKAQTPFYAYVPVWLKHVDGTISEAHETDPKKGE